MNQNEDTTLETDGNTNLGPDYLKSIGLEDGEAPETRLSSAANARSLFMQDVENYRLRSQQNAKVQGLIDGNPPKSAVAMKKSGQAGNANFNDGSAQAFLEIAQTAFYELSSEVDTLAVVKVCLDVPESTEWGQKIQKNFELLLREDSELDYGTQLSQSQMVIYGVGPMIWNDELNWKSEPILNQYFRLPPGAKSSVNLWDRCSIEYQYTVGQLYRFIANEDVATKAGWDVESVKESIKRAGSNMQLPGPYDQWETWQRMLRDNEVYWSDRIPQIRVARLLVKEFSDKDGNEGISDAWIDANGTVDKFLFRKIRRYEKMSQAVAPFFYDRGNGDAHGIKGLGVKMYSLMLQKNRTLCATVDAAYANSSTVLQAVGGGSSQNLEITHFGSFTKIPSGFNYIQRNVTGAMQPLFEVRRELEQTLSGNLSQYRQKQEQVGGNPRTATEVNADLQQSSILGKTQLARYFEQRDWWFQETFRRATNTKLNKNLGEWAKQAIEFQLRCERDGVPPEVFKFCKVKATRTVGQGSSFLRVQSLMSTLQNLGPSLPPEGVERLMKDIIAAMDGQSMVDRYYPSPDQRPTEEQQRWEADNEHSSFRLGNPITGYGTQMHAIHLEEHFKFVQEVAPTVQQGADPAEILKTFDALGQNCAYHLQILSRSPLNRQLVQNYTAQMKELSKVVGELQAHVQAEAQKKAEAQQAQQQAQAIQNGSDPDAQIMAAKAQKDMEIKQAKADQHMALKQQTHNQAMAIADATAAQQIALKHTQAKQSATAKKTATP